MLFRYLLILLFFSFQVKSDQNDLRLDDLFQILSTTKNENKINEITSNIWKIWHETTDLSIEEDFNRGIVSMSAGDLVMAITFFTSVIEKNSKFAEAWNKRATVYYMMGKFDKSMLDIYETLKLEPRHFGAMDGMGLIFIQKKEFDKAMDVYEQMLKIFPNSGSIKAKKELMLNYISQLT